ncbi:acyl-CoA thioesterase FadM [Allocatelliglobosispora scoriae]|uniref:Acyl-CoA thioesterase FadM n=1 Tax=Allocatelliglobosispora scoriae TaxID=643052 RepID=A0A841BIK3_9ACTN|nr:hypothetical protein [Allocatelliglobosispora scoriae]MBB5866731.1 acyl-CoA thioesterase FadM [Allocatelliglobosispora scoriae]
MTRQSAFRLTCSSGMFTQLQLKPRFMLSVAFIGWSGWLAEHAVSHARLIQHYRTGFVPIGFVVTYVEPLTFFDSAALTIRTRVATWNPRRFHTFQEINTDVYADDGRHVAMVYLQEVCVRIESDQTLAALPGRVSDELAPMILDSDREGAPVPRLLNRPRREPAAGWEPLGEHRHDFVVYRHACEVADQWYSEHVPDYIGASREAMVLTQLPRRPGLLPGVANRMESITIGLRQPFAFFDSGQVSTRAFRRGDEVIFTHDLLTAAGTSAGDAVEVFTSS